MNKSFLHGWVEKAFTLYINGDQGTGIGVYNVAVGFFFGNGSALL